MVMRRPVKVDVASRRVTEERTASAVSGIEAYADLRPKAMRELPPLLNLRWLRYP